jgi:quercetin dioxygenase-like cupin family protein
VLCTDVGFDAGMSRFEGAATSEPVRYTPPSRETLLVLEGRARVEIAGGPTLELAPGVMASIPAGTETTWHITPPFKEFWVIG